MYLSFLFVLYFFADYEQNTDYINTMGKCSFKAVWMQEFPWIDSVKGDQYKGWCRYCVKSISVKKGRADIVKHGANMLHLNNSKKEESEARGPSNKQQSSIFEAVEKAKAVQNKQNKAKDSALRFEYGLAVAITNHNIADSFSECVTSLIAKTITDSAIVKEISIKRTKLSYTVDEAIAPNLNEKVLECMRKWPFSLNYDESQVAKKSQCALNVSFRNKNNLIQKANLTTLHMDDSITGKYTCRTVYNHLKENTVPKYNQVSDQTDGCAVMLGKYEGCHEYAKKEVPTLPDLGGCGCHDPSNAIKNGLAAMMPNLTKLYKAIWANLEKHSLKKNRHFKEISEELGLVFKHVPRFVDVRFRYVPLLAKYMIQNDRALYVYYTELHEEVMGGKEPSDTEQVIMDIFLKNYLEVRFTNLFLIDVCQPFLDYIDFFESRKVRCHVRFPKMALLLAEHMGKFVAENTAELSPSQLLKVDVLNPNTWLAKDKVMVGQGVNKLLKETGFTVESRELRNFMESVYRFYKKSTASLIKYFTTPLTSKILR